MPGPSVVRVLASAAALLCVARAGLHSMETDLFEDEEQRRLIEAINWDAERFEEEQIAQLAPGTWKDGIAIPPPNFPDAAIKYIWDFFPPVYNCPLREKVGVQANNADGGKWVCGLRTLLQRTPCVVYSFGSNGEPTFELTLAKKTGCEIHIFDPTLTDEQNKLMKSLPGITFHAYGLGAMDGEVPVLTLHDTMGRNRSAMAVRRLNTIMRGLGHEWLDMLKVDVEGAEWAAFEDLLTEEKHQLLPFTQLQVEYHYFKNDTRTYPPTMFNVMRGLRHRGMRVFNVEPNVRHMHLRHVWWYNTGHDCTEYAYIQVDKDGEIVTGRQEAHRRGSHRAHSALHHALENAHSGQSHMHEAYVHEPAD